VAHPRAAATALRPERTGTAFALAALGGDAEFELDFVKIGPGTGRTLDGPVGNPMADADDHEVKLDQRFKNDNGF
jgi:hypothetical protein